MDWRSIWVTESTRQLRKGVERERSDPIVFLRGEADSGPYTVLADFR